MNLVNVALVVGAGAVVVLVLFSERLSSWSLPAPLLAVVIGAAIGPHALDAIPFDRLAEYRDPLLTEGSRIALGVGLVGVALRLPHGYWQANWRWIAGIIGAGMAVMWLTAAGLLVAVGLPLTIALLVGAMLTPTDPITTTPVVTGTNAEKYVPDRVRFNLSGESGVNDGLGFLFVMLPLLLLTVETPGDAWGQWFLDVVLWKVLGAAALAAGAGAVFGKAYVACRHRGYLDDGSLLIVAIPVGLFMLGLLKLLGTDGILGVFVTAAVFGQVVGQSSENVQDTVADALTRLLMIPLFLLFGVFLPFPAWSALSPVLLLGLAAAVFVRRALAVWLVSPVYRRLHTRPELAFMSWFGPIGVSALYYAMDAAGRLGDERIFAYVSFAIAVSVVAHGLSTVPLSRWLSTYNSRTTETAAGERY
ncbi:MAG: cation:proton antiporter [Actinomycetota bacterium]|nr:cation:proton antiporter [Actinomycetota bacterium]